MNKKMFLLLTLFVVSPLMGADKEQVPTDTSSQFVYTPPFMRGAINFMHDWVSIDEHWNAFLEQINKSMVTVIPDYMYVALKDIFQSLNTAHAENQAPFTKIGALLERYAQLTKEYNKTSEQETYAAQSIWEKERNLIKVGELIIQQQQQKNYSAKILQKMEKAEDLLDQYMDDQVIIIEKQIKLIIEKCFTMFKKHKTLFSSFTELDKTLQENYQTDKEFLVKGKFDTAHGYIQYCQNISQASQVFITELLTILKLLGSDTLQPYKNKLDQYATLFTHKMKLLQTYDKQIAQQKETKKDIIKCAVCSTTGALRQCTGCKDTYYCSQKCQWKDSMNHKLVCFPTDPSLVFTISLTKQGAECKDNNGVIWQKSTGSIETMTAVITHPQTGAVLQLLRDPSAHYGMSFIDAAHKKKYAVTLNAAFIDFMSHLSFFK